MSVHALGIHKCWSNKIHQKYYRIPGSLFHNGDNLLATDGWREGVATKAEYNRYTMLVDRTVSISKEIMQTENQPDLIISSKGLCMINEALIGELRGIRSITALNFLATNLNP